jgi:hypothetical protein
MPKDQLMHGLNSLLRIFFVLILFLSDSHSYAQTDSIRKIIISGNVDLVSRYIWRGQEYGQSPAIQPGLSAGWKGFTIGAWGSYKFAGAGNQETDLYVSRDLGPFSLSIWDYWSFCDTSSMDVFNYNEKSTSHALEAQLLLNGSEKIPFNLLASCFFYGSDSTRSVYVELQYNHTCGPIEMLFFAGIQPKGEYYGKNATFVNLGCTAIKTIRVTDGWSIPLSVSCILNPSNKSFYIVAGVNL